MSADVGGTARTRVRRVPENAVNERDRVNEALDAGLVAHVAVVDEGQPFVIPVAYARDGDRVLFHGSTGSRLFRALAAGAPTCLTVTLLDGVVLARSAFESTMNYRSVVVLGTCTALTGAERDAALRRLTDHLLPGRWDDVRPPSPKELASTLVLALPLDECSLKERHRLADEADGDEALPAWAGYVPIVESFGDPVPDEASLDRPVPPYLRAWTRR